MKRENISIYHNWLGRKYFQIIFNAAKEKQKMVKTEIFQLVLSTMDLYNILLETWCTTNNWEFSFENKFHYQLANRIAWNVCCRGNEDYFDHMTSNAHNNIYIVLLQLHTFRLILQQCRRILQYHLKLSCLNEILRIKTHFIIEKRARNVLKSRNVCSVLTKGKGKNAFLTHNASGKVKECLIFFR